MSMSCLARKPCTACRICWPSVRAHLAHLYGTLAEEVLAAAREDPELLRPLHPDAPDIAAQALSEVLTAAA